MRQGIFYVFLNFQVTLYFDSNSEAASRYQTFVGYLLPSTGLYFTVTPEAPLKRDLWIF